jgi:hypothetical protein
VTILSELGIDPDDLRWESLAACQNMDRDWFFDLDPDDPDQTRQTYSDPVIAVAVDTTCMSCPVINECLNEGIENKRWGVWGGVYLTDGSITGRLNKHKTEEVWDEWRRITV